MITSVITNVNGVAAKTTTMRAVAIGWDAIAVVSTRGMVDSHGLNTSGARSRALPCNNEGGWRICNNTRRKRRMEARKGVGNECRMQRRWSGRNVLPYEIVVPVANTEDGEEGRDDGVCPPGGAEDSHMEGRGGGASRL